VLLVEDMEILRDMVATMLMYLGFKVLTAKDGIEAVEIFRQSSNEIHVVLSDLSMPRMNGWETLSALRRIRPDIPVILTSGYDEAQVIAGAHSELPQAFLHKPYQMAMLKDALAKAMKG
jgi:CheY-like chemotaxis protein